MSAFQGPPAFILGLYDTGLAVGRALASQGVKVFGFDWQVENPGFHSRFIQSERCPDPIDQGKELLAHLHDSARRQSTRPVLYPCSDAFLQFLQAHRGELEKDFIFVAPEAACLEAVLSKDQQL